MSDTERVAKLSERLKTLQLTIRTGKATKSNELEGRIQLVEQQYKEVREKNNSKFEALKDDVILIKHIANQSARTIRRGIRQKGRTKLQKRSRIQGNTRRADISY